MSLLTFILFENEGKRILANTDLLDLVSQDGPHVVFQTFAGQRVNFPASSFNLAALQKAYHPEENYLDKDQDCRGNPLASVFEPLLQRPLLICEDRKNEMVFLVEGVPPQRYVVCAPFQDIADALVHERHKIVDARPQPDLVSPPVL